MDDRNRDAEFLGGIPEGTTGVVERSDAAWATGGVSPWPLKPLGKDAVVRTTVNAAKPPVVVPQVPVEREKPAPQPEPKPAAPKKAKAVNPCAACQGELDEDHIDLGVCSVCLEEPSSVPAAEDGIIARIDAGVSVGPEPVLAAPIVVEGIDGAPIWRAWTKVAGANGHFKKVPCDEKGKKLKAWQLIPALTKAEAAAYKQAGVGILLGQTPSYTAIDIDKCVDKPLAQGAIEAAQRMGAYIERSPSGTGLHIVGRGEAEPFELTFKDADGGHINDLPAPFLTITGDEAQGDIELNIDALLKTIRSMYSTADTEDAETQREPADGPKVGDVLAAVKKFGLLIDDTRPDWLDIRCPWASGHGDAGRGDDRRDASIRIEQGHAAGFKCFHGSCSTRTLKDALEFLGLEKPQSAELEEFWCFAPDRNFIFIPTSDHWGSQAVNDRCRAIPAGRDKEGKRKYTKPSDWLARKRVVAQKTWYPGEPQIVADKLLINGQWVAAPGERVFNLYRPPLMTAGDATKARPWINLVKRLYPNEWEHLIAWFAHRVQFPGVKINHALVLGGVEGAGKDSLLEPVIDAVGMWNVYEISPTDILETFNPFVQSVILRISEVRDLGDIDRRAFYEHMKTYIAAPPNTLTCNDKHIRQFAVPNVTGVVMTTNYDDALYLSSNDRRHFVVYSDAKATDCGADEWDQFHGWLRAEGCGHVAAYLRQPSLLDRFNPKAPPAHTAAFKRMLNAARPAEDDDVIDAIEALGNPGALTVDELAAVDPELGMSFASPDGRNKVARRLKAAGYVAFDNPDDHRGRWMVGGKRGVVYVKREFSNEKEKHAAVSSLQAKRSRPAQQNIPGVENRQTP